MWPVRSKFKCIPLDPCITRSLRTVTQAGDRALKIYRVSRTPHFSWNQMEILGICVVMPEGQLLSRVISDQTGRLTAQADRIRMI